MKPSLSAKYNTFVLRCGKHGLDTLHVLHLALLKTSRLSHLPDIVAEIGPELAMKLMQKYSGETIEFPSVDLFILAIKKAYIYRYLEAKGHGDEHVNQLAYDLSVAPKWIEDVYTEMSRFVSDFNWELNKAYEDGSQQAEDAAGPGSGEGAGSPTGATAPAGTTA